MKTKRSSGSAILAGLLLAAGSGPQAKAQMNQAEQGPITDRIDEITVTARKRVENLQDVPVAVDALPAEELARKGIVDLQDITRQVPSLGFEKGFAPQDIRITVRGLSPTRGRQNVAVLLDGYDISSEAIQTAGGSLMIDPNLFDLQQVEVVKGPQVALYGRSAFNGALSYTTRQPAEVFTGQLRTEAGNNGLLRLSGFVSGPLADGLYGEIAALTYNEDGWIGNTVTDAKVGGQSGNSVAGTLKWEARDDLSLLFRASYSNDNYDAEPWGYMNPNGYVAIPANALVSNGGFIPDDFPPAQDVAALLGIPGLLPLIPGQVPGAFGKIPDGDSLKPRMSQNPRNGQDYGGTDRNTFRATLTLNWDINDRLELVSMSQGMHSDVTQFEDGNTMGSVSTLPFESEVLFKPDTDTVSQEFRLQSRGDAKLDWLVGAMYWQERVNFTDGSFNCFTNALPFAPSPTGVPPFSPPLPLVPCASYVADIGEDGTYPRISSHWDRDTKSYSAYFLADYDFTDQWTGTLEGRYVSEHLHVAGPAFTTIIDPLGLGYNQDPQVLANCTPYNTGSNPPAGLPPNFTFPNSCVSLVQSPNNSGDDSDSFFVPKATVRWKPNETQMYYASIAESKKPGGISTVTGGIGGFNPDNARFAAEKLTVYELGGKTDWMDRRLQLNGALFYQDYKDKQVSTQVPVPEQNLLAAKVVNVPAEVYGAEFQYTWLITEYLSWTGAYTWLHSEYKDTDAIQSRSTGTIAYSGGCQEILGTGSQARCLLDYSGNELEYTPENTFATTLGYRRPLNATFDWFAEGDANYQGSRYVDQANTLKLDSYWLANFRLGISSEQWEVLAYVDNAFDDDTVKSAFASVDPRYVAFGLLAAPPFVYGPLIPNGARVQSPDPRTYGLRLTYKFGGK